MGGWCFDGVYMSSIQISPILFIELYYSIMLSAICYTALGTNFGGYFEQAAASGIDAPISMVQATIASFVVSSGCIAFSDVVADGIVVQRTRDSDDPKVAGGLQSLCWGSVSIRGHAYY